MTEVCIYIYKSKQIKFISKIEEKEQKNPI